MKRNRKRLIQLIFIFLLVTAVILLKNYTDRFLLLKTDQPFSTIDKAAIKELIVTQDKTTSLYKKNGKWTIKKNGVEYPADQEKLESLINAFINLEKSEAVSNNKARHTQLGIGKQKIELKSAGKKYVIFVGDDSGLGNNYVRIDNENEVFFATGFSDLTTTEDFRDLTVPLVKDEEKVRSIEIGYESISIIINKKGKDWKIGDKIAKKDRVDFYLNDLKTLKATDILPQDTNFPDIIPTVIKITENDREKTISFYGQDENNYLANSSESEFIFQIPAAYIASLKKEESDFVE
ncbi:hypothetical protein A2774_04580 [Candidatus Roizmanbacteria bacterium RIFCSPHIGHO2_01_FULL_39_12c]|uniref:DUF4340 domain-containing protein n=1 Tax=Candidatus Roizmanbacteria bacterium RIFCSPHIGHO2_01_FULL_39_12c TaxID=1802031 RepID=A0A1F7GCC8_9BACT|nr:MAG: hypothetical protein A2774_04580 [Candidatus Roizmanbacteria bacterium RIFCSPHIGHO2_01_FULL_39_12c]OGK47882.1 MAG: hypothetical protein A2963_03455 [Candidatus Roizmanbacteria bacterium RIFCSPLOWO2_01_FULL_40_13]